MEGMNMKKHFWALALATPLLLSACGGSDETSTTEPYVGTWLKCSPPSNGSGLALATLLMVEKIDNSTLKMTPVSYSGSSPDCKDLGLSIRPYVSYTYVLQGPKTIGDDEGEKAAIVEGVGAPFKTLLLIKGGKLYFGDKSKLDTEGFPDAFAFDEPWTAR
jgi:hypothetical protein